MLKTIKRWFFEEDAVAAVEAGLIFPLMITLLAGVYDTGTALNINQKVVNASFMMADILTRDQDIDDTEFNEAALAARFAIEPYDTVTFGYDVAGIQFVGAGAVPTVQWRETFNMDSNADVTVTSVGLGSENEGVVAATVQYTYSPFFFGIIMMGDLEMKEAFYARGRESAYVMRNGV